MEIHTREEERVQLLDCAGPMTLADGLPLLRESFGKALAAGREDFLLNLVAVPYIDSPSIGEVVACLKRAKERGGTLKLLVNPETRVHQVLTLTALDRLLDVFTDGRDALGSFGD